MTMSPLLILRVSMASHIVDAIVADAINARPADVAALMKESPTGRLRVDRPHIQSVYPLSMSTTERSPMR